VIILLVVCTATDADCPADKPHCTEIEGTEASVCYA